ncbi:MAG: class I SAM-dependent methyltransferase [Eubacteriales bacterium]
MDIDELYKIKDESEQVEKLYEIFNEDSRLNSSKAARVEFLTTAWLIERYIKPGDKILDIGAGAGEYSLYFAEKGFEVCSLELAQNNINAFRKKINPAHSIELVKGNALDLSRYADNSFDIVLLFGPLYHLHSESDRQKCISEAKRVCKNDGTLFFAFINNDMVCITEFCNNEKYFLGDSYYHDTFKVKDFPFVFFTVSECREMLQKGGIEIISEVASDGMSELLEDKINRMDEESYKQYLRYHFYTCEKPEMIGHSNHLLFAGKKK